MKRNRSIVLLAVLACLTPVSARASDEVGWWAVHRADAAFDLPAARRADPSASCAEVAGRMRPGVADRPTARPCRRTAAST